MARKIIFSNQKGGVGKTTSAINTAAALALQQKRILLVDTDRQAHATIALGVNRPPAPSWTEFIQQIGFPQEIKPRLFFIPALEKITDYEVQIFHDPKKLLNLKQAINSLEEHFDFVIFDCPPNLGVITLSVFLAGEEVIVPMPAHFFALQGLAETKALIDRIKNKNPKLRLYGILLTFFNPHLRHSKAIVEEISRVFGKGILLPPIRNSIRLAEAPSFAQTIFEHAPQSKAAEDYMRLAQTILAQGEKIHEKS